MRGLPLSGCSWGWSRETLNSLCAAVPLERTTQAQKTREEWEQTVTRMVGQGAQLTEAEQATLIEYLAATYGP